MKRKLIFVAMAMAALISVSASAASKFQIGVIDMHHVMAQSSEVKKIRNDLQKTFKPREEELVKARDSIKNDAEKLNKNATVMTKADKEKAERKLIDAQRSLQQKQMEFQQDVMKAQNEALKSFIDKVKSDVGRIAAKRHFNIVLTKDVVAFTDDSLEITDEVIRDINKS